MLYYLKYATHEVEKLNQLLYFFFEKVEHTNPAKFDSATLFPAWYNEVPIHRMKTLENLLTEFIQFDQAIKDRIIAAFREANRIEAHFSDFFSSIPTAVDFDNIAWKTVNIGANSVNLTIKDFLDKLFVYLYTNQLGNKESSFSKSVGTNLGKQYDDFVELNNVDFSRNMICPFCGMEKMRDEVNIRKPDHDHLLPKGDSLYVFSSVNLKNLFPIGSDCNIKKGTQNLLYSDDLRQNRAIAFYPYDNSQHPFELYTIKLICQEVPQYSNKYRGKWEVSILPNNDQDAITRAKIETWDRVFGIKERIIKSICDSNKSLIDMELNLTRETDVASLSQKIQDQIDRLPYLYNNLSTIIDLVPKRIFFEWAKDDNSFLTDRLASKLGVQSQVSVDLNFN